MGIATRALHFHVEANYLHGRGHALLSRYDARIIRSLVDGLPSGIPG